jgi:hypothetical protein
MPTFHHLIELNFLAQRSFEDLAQCPVFPCVVADFASEELDLADASVFRDLSLPVGALNEVRMARLRRRPHFETAPPTVVAVVHFLQRLEPFAMMGSARLFASVPDEFAKVVSEADDFRDLPPQFFFLPKAFAGAELPRWAQTPLESDFVSPIRIAGSTSSSDVRRQRERKRNSLSGSILTLCVFF